MTRFRFPTVSRATLSAGLALAAPALTFAQDATPAPPAADATAAAPATDAAPDGQPADPFAVPEDESFLLQEPQTPEEFFRAVTLAQKLARPNLARLYLQRFLALNPDDDTLLRLRDEYGPATFARLANAKELQPLSTQLADRVNEVFRRRGADPQRINALIDALNGPPEQAIPARESLINAGETVIPQALQRLATTTDDTIRAQLLDVLAGMRGVALPALHAALDAPNDAFKIDVLSVIGRIGSPTSIPYLYIPAYAPGQAVAVRSAARRALADIARTSSVAADVTEPADVAARLADEAVRTSAEPAAPPDAAAEPAEGVRVWSWDPQAGTVRAAVVAPRSAALINATRLAHAAFRLAPDRPETQSLYLAFLLASEADRAGAAEPPAGPGTAFNAALAAGPKVALDVLRQALRYEIPRAAVGALAVLAQTASPNVLYSDEPLVADALNAPDPRVQLAAAVAVLRLNPDRPFRHAGRVVEILSRALSDMREPTAVIIDPNVQRGSTIAGFVRELGYDAIVAQSGQRGFAIASQRTRPSFLLVNLNVSEWPLSQTLANVRADARTRDVPVVVYGPGAGEWDARPVGATSLTYFRGPGVHDPRGDVTEYLSQVPGTAYVVATATGDAFAAQVRPVLARLNVDPLTPAERTQARAVAAFWLAQIADTRRTDLFPLAPAEPALAGALSDPDVAGNALIALAAIPTPSAQRAIAEIVLAPTTDGGIRRSAAGTLSEHARRYGVLIPKSTVADLYRLEQTTQDADLRTALAAWGGTLEPGSAYTRRTLEAVAPAAPVAPNP